MNHRASVLVGVLWCLALLSLVVIGVLHTARMDLLVTKNYGDRLQAHYLAVAGIEKAKALLYLDARDRSRSRLSHGAGIYSAPEQLRDVRLGRGQFRVMRRPHPDEYGDVIFGVDDEESRLDLNVASAEELARIDGMTTDLLAAILDWRDADATVTVGGAEADYYTSLRPPRLPRNGPFETVRELLMVRGVSPELLLGRKNRATSSADAADSTTSTGSSFGREGGWDELLTVNSAVNNVNSAGEDRVDLQSAAESALTAVRGITPDIAKAIVAYRGQNRLNNIADLLDVPAAPGPNQVNLPSPSGPPPGSRPGATPQSPQPVAPSGPPIISADLLMQIADDVTVGDATSLKGLVNVNSASAEVLYCLAGVDRELAHAIVAHRQSSGFFPNVAHLLKVPGVSKDVLKRLAPRLTARSETFRILGEGTINSSHARVRIQEIVHVTLRRVTTVSYREEDL